MKLTKFETKVEIPYFACDKNGKMRLSYILDYLGEASSGHSDSLGIGFKELNKNNYAWILNRWKIVMYRYPRLKDSVVIKTWTSKVYKFYANREFLMYDSSGNLLGKATTVWVFLNTDSKKPIRIPEEVERKYNIGGSSNFQEFFKFRNNIDVKESREFSTRRSDIDYNNHVNNVRYLDWIIETIPQKFYEEYHLKEVEIQYRQEVRYGERIKSRISEGLKDNENISFLHTISLEDSSSIHTYARTIWEKI